VVRAGRGAVPGDPPRAGRRGRRAGGGLVELAIPELRRSRQEATIRGWLDAIPDEVVRVRPVLAVGFIGALMAGGEFDGVEDRLEDVERRLEATGDHAGAWTLPEGMVAVDGGELLRLPVAMETYRAALALVPGDAPATIDHAQRAIHRAADEDDLTRAGASALMGLALWGGGDLEAAHRAYCLAAEGLRRTGYIADVLGCSITLADLRITHGRLREGLRTYEQAQRLASDQDGTVLRGTADMHVGMSQIACERDFSPNVRPIPALRARVLAAQGRVGEALAWAREQGLSAADDLSYLREFEHVTLARALLAQHRAQRSESALHDPARLLRRLLRAAEARERTGSVIEILVLRALTDHARGDVPGALAALERALTLAEPEGYVRVFAAEAPPMASLLRRVARQRADLGLRPPAAERPRPRRRDHPGRPGHTRQAAPRRAPERARAGRAPAARLRPRRSRHRP
jgi:LuxR family maltose regulon positive regulatory protein